MKIVKWKIRRMRKNPLPAKPVGVSSFDFEVAARKLRRQRNLFGDTKKKSHKRQHGKKKKKNKTTKSRGT